MFKTKHITLLDSIDTMIMFFSMGCLFGAEYPGIPFVVWIILIFAGACAKVWLHHQAEKVLKSEKQRTASESDKDFK